MISGDWAAPAIIAESLSFPNHNTAIAFAKAKYMGTCFPSDTLIQIYTATSSNIISTVQSYIVLHQTLDFPLLPPQENQEKLACVRK